ncbi:MAG: cation:proton antiporter [Pseudomonadota bacterium]
MIAEPLIMLALCLVAYSAYSARLGAGMVSAPMAFMVAGIVTGAGGLGLVSIDVDSHVLEGFGEITLALILFADAAGTNAKRLTTDYRIPRRLLLISLPLTILLGAVIATFAFPDLSWAEAALIAAILAPTDAALGLAVVTSPHVPERIRQGLLVESGFNDGLALPAVLLFAALAYGAEAQAGQPLSYWLQFALTQIVIGAVVGAVLGGALGKLLVTADDRGWMAHSFRNLASMGVAILILFAAHLAGGNGFIAAFAGGLVFGGFCSKRAGALTNFVEEEGQLFSLIIFFVFGAALLPAATDHFTIVCIAYALLSLTLIRMLPTWISLTGANVSLPSTAFIGWFGPRGLASILFLLIAVEHQEMERLSQVEAIVYVTVFFSVMLHGATAAPLSKRLGDRLKMGD